MRKVINTCHVEGYLYEHKLELKITGEKSKNPGTEYITGTVSIVTDDELVNVVQVHFTYVTAVTSKGKANATFNILQAIVDGKLGSVMDNGKENACMLRIDTAIGLNEWYDKTDGTLVSVKRNEGGFVHQTQKLGIPQNRSTFDADMLITSFEHVEADERKSERGIIKGYIFDFKKSLLPVEFTVYNEKGIEYFEGMDVSTSNPMFTEVRGTQVSKTSVKTVEEEGAFGDVSIREVRTSERDFVVTWVKPVPYEWDSDDILATELDEMIANRELYLAEIKKRQEDYEASKNENGFSVIGNTNTSTTAVKKGDYDF